MSRPHSPRRKRAASELQVLNLRHFEDLPAAELQRLGLREEAELMREAEAVQVSDEAREAAAEELDELAALDTSPIRWRTGERSYKGMFADEARIYTDLAAHAPEEVARRMVQCWQLPSYFIFRLSDERVRLFGQRATMISYMCFLAAAILPLPVHLGWAFGSSIFFIGMAFVQFGLAQYLFSKEPSAPDALEGGAYKDEGHEFLWATGLLPGVPLVAVGYHLLATRPGGWHEVVAGMAVWAFWAMVLAFVIAFVLEVVEYRSLPRGEGAMRALWRDEVSKDAPRNRWRHELLELASRHDSLLEALKTQVKLARALERRLPAHLPAELGALKKLRARIERGVAVGRLIIEHGESLQSAMVDGQLGLRSEVSELGRVEALAEHLLEGRLVSGATQDQFDARLQDAARRAVLN